MGWLTRRRSITLALCAVLVVAALGVRLFAFAHAGEEPEIALTIGEPWEDMRKRSSAEIPEAIAGHVWGRVPKTDARLRFVYAQYGFVTPLARFLTVGFDEKGLVEDVFMSPQIESLLLDDALKVVLDLENQLQKKGWRQILVKDWPLIEDTPKWRMQLRDPNGNGTVTYWHASDKFQVLLGIRRFKDEKHPNEERYLIDLNLARPWTDP